MDHRFLMLRLAGLAAGVMLSVGALAATVEEAAAKVAQDWRKAVMAMDVDAQVDLLPKAMFEKPEERERARKMRLHDKELAIIRGEKFLSFELLQPLRPVTVGKATIVVVPYKSVVQVAEGRLQRDSSLVALDLNGNSDWAVFDGSGHSVRSLKKFIPGYVGNPPLNPARTQLLKTG